MRPSSTVHPDSPAAPTPIAAVLCVSFFVSLGTGVFWNGLSFIAKHGYGFGEMRNFILFAVMGALYTVAAWKSGVITRFVERLASPRSVLAIAIALQALFCLAPVTFDHEWALWAAAVGVTATAAITWPLMESYLTSGRHGRDMRSAIGWFNVTWTTAVFLPLFLMAPILEHHAAWAIGGLSVINLVGLAPVFMFARRPGHHDAAIAAANVTEEYPHLLRSARVLLPLSYVLMSAMTPILPYKLADIGVDVHWETPASATWMVVRVVALVIMWRLPFWHGRWGALLLGAVTMIGGFGTVVLAPAVDVLLTGFVVYGVGMGVIYYAALYYGMAVGRGAVDAGGAHEALIGAGYGVGPLAGIVATLFGGGGAAIVGIVWGIMALGAAPVVIPYRRARRRRAAAGR